MTGTPSAESPKPAAVKRRRSSRQQGVFIRISDHLNLAMRELAASRRVSLRALYESAIAAYVSPGAQDQRDALLGRQLNRFTRSVESVDWNTKLLIAMMRYQIELDLSFLPEPVAEEERRTVAEKGARRFDRFEQWLMRSLVDPDSLYNRLQGRLKSLERHDNNEEN